MEPFRAGLADDAPAAGAHEVGVEAPGAADVPGLVGHRGGDARQRGGVGVVDPAQRRSRANETAALRSVVA